MMWIHKYLILRGSWKSWEEITRTSEWVWKWETGIDQPCENLFVKHFKVRKKKEKKRLGFPCDNTPNVFSHQPLLQLCPAALLKDSPPALSKPAAQLSSSNVILVFMWTQVIFQPLGVSQGQNAQKLLQKQAQGRGKGKINRYYRQDKEGSKPLAWRPP